jgi:NADPH2:quinone reductase
MSGTVERTGLQLRSLVKADGELELSLAKVAVPAPADDEVVIRVEATPINPSDLGLLFGGADMAGAEASSGPDGPVVRARIAPGLMGPLAGRVGHSLQVGNEGAGTVVEAGASPAAQALLGRTVALVVGAMHAQYRVVKAAECLALPEGATARDGAALFVNPLTAIGMVQTMRMENHMALVHTAAASNLGQMLVKLCLEEGVELVNVVRSPAQVAILRDLGAVHVVDTSAPGFMEALTEAMAVTGATVAFDAIGGGSLASQILTAMEAAAIRSATSYNRYGSTVHKQVHMYGALDTSPTVLSRNFGLAWGIDGWLMTPVLQKAGPAGVQAMRQRALAGMKTIFASQYTREISLFEALQLDVLAGYNKRATGEKYLINPSLG